MIETRTHPCVIIRCDRCEQGIDWNGEGGEAHYENEAEALDAAQDCDWYVKDGVVLCLGCCEDAPFYEVACPLCGAAKEESCNGQDDPLFCRPRVAALAAAVVAKNQEDS